MLRIAVTGNIGSGKTTICKVFESLGIHIYYADPEARKFYSRPDVIESVKLLFGEDVFDEGGELIRSKLAERAFKDDTKLKQLNGIIHPLVLDDFLKWAEKHENEAYILYESALLFESGFYKHFDKSILITTPTETAMQRVMDRDGLSEEEFMARLARQMPQEEKIKLADHVLENDEKSMLIPKVIALHEQFLSPSN